MNLQMLLWKWQTQNSPTISESDDDVRKLLGQKVA